jgi:hypothetical protein
MSPLNNWCRSVEDREILANPVAGVLRNNKSIFVVRTLPAAETLVPLKMTTAVEEPKMD